KRHCALGNFCSTQQRTLISAHRASFAVFAGQSLHRFVGLHESSMFSHCRSESPASVCNPSVHRGVQGWPRKKPAEFLKHASHFLSQTTSASFFITEAVEVYSGVTQSGERQLKSPQRSHNARPGIARSRGTPRKSRCDTRATSAALQMNDRPWARAHRSARPC